MIHVLAFDVLYLHIKPQSVEKSKKNARKKTAKD